MSAMAASFPTVWLCCTVDSLDRTLAEIAISACRRISDLLESGEYFREEICLKLPLHFQIGDIVEFELDLNL